MTQLRWVFAASAVCTSVACGGVYHGDLSGPDALAQAARAADGLLPDIQEEPPKHLQIQNEHQREMLRFTTTHWNTGAGHLRIRGDETTVAPCTVDGVSYETCTHAEQEILDAHGNVVATSPAGVAVYHPEHNHWHQNSVALFEVRAGSPTGPAVTPAGLKVTFCLIDFDKSDLVHQNNTRVYWECNGDLQGISPGWGDEYHQSTEGQELDITGIPAGTYYLINQADPSNHWIEADDTNNLTWTKFDLVRGGGANPKLANIEYGPCQGISCGNTANK